jgi:DNA-directed RNA polymerase specialized sigma24 family protein
MGKLTERADSAGCPTATFRTTHWSVVLEAAGDASPQGAAALESLCRTYWYPLYACVRRQGHSPEDAQDITQEFFARLLRLNSLRDVGREKGKFRTFLLASLNHFMADHWDRASAAKRGGGRTPLPLDEGDAEHRYAADLAVDLAPEKLFDRRWALTVLNNALTRLQKEFAEAGKSAQFDALKVFLSSEAAPGTYETLAPQLNLTPRATSMAVCRLRQRYAELVRSEVADTVAGPDASSACSSRVWG